MKIEDNKIIFSTKVVVLPYTIGKHLTINNLLLAVLDIPIGQTFNENVYCINSDGNIIWQIKKQDYLYRDSPYVGLRQDAIGNIWLINWDGAQYRIDIFTGNVLEEVFYK